MTHESRLTRELRALLHTQRVAALGTLGDNGAPQVSMVPYAIAPSCGCLVLHVSGLAAHTRNLQKAPAVSLLVMQPGWAAHVSAGVAIRRWCQTAAFENAICRHCVLPTRGSSNFWRSSHAAEPGAVDSSGFSGAFRRPYVSKSSPPYRTAGFSRITSAIPPRIATDARTRRRLRGSASSTTPPAAAITGTLSCTVAAWVALSAGRAVYQMA